MALKNQILCLYNFKIITKTSNLEEHTNNIREPKNQFSEEELSVLAVLFFLIAAVASHLEVHGHGSICSLLSDQGDWHKMVSSSQLIDYNLISLQSKQLNHCV